MEGSPKQKKSLNGGPNGKDVWQHAQDSLKMPFEAAASDKDRGCVWQKKKRMEFVKCSHRNDLPG